MQNKAKSHVNIIMYQLFNKQFPNMPMGNGVMEQLQTPEHLNFIPYFFVANIYRSRVLFQIFVMAPGKIGTE
jgi:hypothetical protein